MGHSQRYTEDNLHLDDHVVECAASATATTTMPVVAAAPRYRFDPYSTRCGVVPTTPDGRCAASMVDALHAENLEAGTLHAAALAGKVTFVPYPTETFEAPEHSSAQRDVNEQVVRVFIGQLPYSVTEMQLAWICFQFSGHCVFGAERIMKRAAPGGERLPTGCLHAYIGESRVNELINGISKRVLVDNTGVWSASTAVELQMLDAYVKRMKASRHHRQHVKGLPYETIRIELATSSFVPANVHSISVPQYAAAAAKSPSPTSTSTSPVSRRSTATPPPYRPREEAFPATPPPSYFQQETSLRAEADVFVPGSVSPPPYGAETEYPDF